jgi:hypothetical protein
LYNFAVQKLERDCDGSFKNNFIGGSLVNRGHVGFSHTNFAEKEREVSEYTRGRK